MPPERCRVWGNNLDLVQPKAGGCAKPDILIPQTPMRAILANKRREASNFFSFILLISLRPLPREVAAKQCFVFGRVGLQEDSQMPSRKAVSCPHRKRLGQNVAALRARRKLTQEELAGVTH